MARHSGWRKVCPEVVRDRQTSCPRLFLLRQSGPTAFTLQEKHHVVRVRLGDPHECSCSTYRKERELCCHICWTLVKKLRVSPDDPLSYQLGLVPQELEAIVKGTHNTRHVQKPSPTAPVPSRPISPRDVCPICLENLIKSRRPVTRCKYGCGRPVHVSCVCVLGEFHRLDESGKTALLKCPMCRGDFCTWDQLHKLNSRRRPRRLRLPPLVPPPVLHSATCCSCLVCPVPGALYKCIQCPLVLLCAACAATTVLHQRHQLAIKQTPQDRWCRIVQKSTTNSELVLPAMRVQQCSISPERSRSPSPIRSSSLDVTRLKLQRRKPAVPPLGLGTSLGSVLHVTGLSLSDRRDHKVQRRFVSPLPHVRTCKYSSPSSKSFHSTLNITSLTFPEHLTCAPSTRR
ncbi:hypothetical protein L9F63_015735, partial [Diploptera punctata]